MSHDTEPERADDLDEQGHGIPEWYMPEGEVRIGDDPEPEGVRPGGEPFEPGWSPRLTVATNNGHRMFGTFGGRGDGPGNRDVDGRLSCLSCSCDGRDLELIVCPARNASHTHVTLSEERIEALRREAEATGEPATPDNSLSAREEQRRFRGMFNGPRHPGLSRNRDRHGRR